MRETWAVCNSAELHIGNQTMHGECMFIVCVSLSRLAMNPTIWQWQYMSAAWGMIVLVYRYWIKAHSFGDTLTYFAMKSLSSEAADLERSGVTGGLKWAQCCYLLSFCMSVFRPYPHHRECDKCATRLSELVGIGGGVWAWCSNLPAMWNDMGLLCTGRVFGPDRSSCLLGKACQGASQAGRRGSSHSSKKILASGYVGFLTT